MFPKFPVLFLSLALSSSVVLGLPNPHVRDQRSSVRFLALLIGGLLSNPHLIKVSSLSTSRRSSILFGLNTIGLLVFRSVYSIVFMAPKPKAKTMPKATTPPTTTTTTTTTTMRRPSVSVFAASRKINSPYFKIWIRP